jgi:transcriptional regulator with XRE-family HTH domain
MTRDEVAAAAFIPTDSLANRLVLVRRELGLSQREAAQRCGVGFGSWQSWENGSAPRNAIRDLVRVVQALNVDRDWLMFGGPLRAAPASE